MTTYIVKYQLFLDDPQTSFFRIDADNLGDALLALPEKFFKILKTTGHDYVFDEDFSSFSCDVMSIQEDTPVTPIFIRSLLNARKAFEKVAESIASEDQDRQSKALANQLDQAIKLIEENQSHPKVMRRDRSKSISFK